ncbi:hypothetical protein [Halomonas sp. CKK8]|uniref:hypothetical protein n=1 Tax=Halomonas sp. CKK8 TaxID=3036127 RepID=UPI0024157E33|nr:hypothetical protein [Halomonas sp. CKK8]WFM72278.1 hypothetical protein P8934_04535 [Halomonas sp. CKK8]
MLKDFLALVASIWALTSFSVKSTGIARSGGISLAKSRGQVVPLMLCASTKTRSGPWPAVHLPQHGLGVSVAGGGKADDYRQGLAVLLPLMVPQSVGVGVIGTGQRDVTEQEAQEHEFLEDGYERVSSGMVCLRPAAPRLPMPCRSTRSSLASTKPENGKDHQNDHDGTDDIDDVVH